MIKQDCDQVSHIDSSKYGVLSIAICINYKSQLLSKGRYHTNTLRCGYYPGAVITQAAASTANMTTSGMTDLSVAYLPSCS